MSVHPTKNIKQITLDYEKFANFIILQKIVKYFCCNSSIDCLDCNDERNTQTCLT